MPSKVRDRRRLFQSDLPVWAVWNDLNERKQRLRLTDPDIIDPRPEPQAWIANYTESGD